MLACIDKCYLLYQLVIHLSLQVIQYQEQSNLAFQLPAQSQNQDELLNLENLRKYCLMPIPPNFGIRDGFFSKINRVTILHFLL